MREKRGGSVKNVGESTEPCGTPALINGHGIGAATVVFWECYGNDIVIDQVHN